MIFVDTSFLVAYTLASDSRHADAVALRGPFSRAPLVTSTIVLGETWTTLDTLPALLSLCVGDVEVF